MSRKKSKEKLKGVNLPIDLWEQVEQRKIDTGVPIKRFIIDAVKAALAK